MFTRRYMFTREEDLPRARAVWESTAQTNFRKSLWEARDKVAKIAGSQDPGHGLDGLRPGVDGKGLLGVPLSSLGYWTMAVERHELERAPTFRKLFDRTHKRKGTYDYISESARMIVETYDRTMAKRYLEGTPQPDLDPEAWVDAVGGQSVQFWGQFGYYSSVVLICEFSRSSGLREFICCNAPQ
ncbi:hypothetical protein Taro_011869 [Colocasia esculenta]|uniref:Uncharacterized protein n=1 Tax=Colocasia esculenta TaxID=4460 RepID=A0A843U2J0_COLES|nr:hypothetical protein [Colocasia esculenta]